MLNGKKNSSLAKKWTRCFNLRERKQLLAVSSLGVLVGVAMSLSLASWATVRRHDSVRTSRFTFPIGGTLVSTGVISVGDLTSLLLYTVYVGNGLQMLT